MVEEKQKTPDRLKLEAIFDYLSDMSEGTTISYVDLGKATNMAPEEVHRIVGAWMTQTMYDATTKFASTLKWNGPDKYCWLFFEHITEINTNKEARKFFLKEGTVKDKLGKLFRR